jgi:hypothetical protein
MRSVVGQKDNAGGRYVSRLSHMVSIKLLWTTGPGSETVTARK